MVKSEKPVPLLAPAYGQRYELIRVQKDLTSEKAAVTFAAQIRNSVPEMKSMTISGVDGAPDAEIEINDGTLEERVLQAIRAMGVEADIINPEAPETEPATAT